MINMSLKKTLALSLSILSFNVTACCLISKDLLAKQCHELSDTVTALISSQANSTCVQKLSLASVQIESASSLILQSSSIAAKSELDNAVYALQYAELNSCNRYIEISHSKFEAIRIKNAL